MQQPATSIPHNRSEIPVPARMSHLKIWRGFPVTYVTQVSSSGEPDFRVLDFVRAYECMQWRLCAICGGEIPRDQWACFIGGDQCVSRRIFTDPAMHIECAYYSAQVCPYLANTRRTYAAGETKTAKAGEVATMFIVENERPARMGLYKCRKYKVLRFPDGQVYCKADKAPSQIDWDVMPVSSPLKTPATKDQSC